VKVIHILGDQEGLSTELFFQFSEGIMTWVGAYFRGEELVPSFVIKVVDEWGISFKAFGRGDILNTVVFPEAILISKGFYSRFCGNTGASKNDNVVKITLG
jgi:hypothetical protein